MSYFEFFLEYSPTVRVVLGSAIVGAVGTIMVVVQYLRKVTNIVSRIGLVLAVLGIATMLGAWAIGEIASPPLRDNPEWGFFDIIDK